MGVGRSTAPIDAAIVKEILILLSCLICSVADAEPDKLGVHRSAWPLNPQPDGTGRCTCGLCG